MSWHDPARSEESAEDVALRDELRQLLGGPAPQAQAQPTAESIALAEDLHREAMRRKHTPNVVTFRRRPTLALLAAALPVALVIGGVGAWGVHQKRKAEALAAAVAARDAELQRRERSHEEALRREREALVAVSQPAKGAPNARPQRGPREVVLPAERPNVQQPLDLQRVKDPK